MQKNTFQSGKRGNGTSRWIQGKPSEACRQLSRGEGGLCSPDLHGNQANQFPVATKLMLKGYVTMMGEGWAWKESDLGLHLRSGSLEVFDLGKMFMLCLKPSPTPQDALGPVSSPAVPSADNLQRELLFLDPSNSSACKTQTPRLTPCPAQARHGKPPPSHLAALGRGPWTWSGPERPT